MGMSKNMALRFGNNIWLFRDAIQKASDGKIIMWASPKLRNIAIIAWDEYNRLMEIEKDFIRLTQYHKDLTEDMRKNPK